MFDLLVSLLKTFGINFVIWYIGGLLVKRGVKTNYTRKINHFSLMIIPLLAGVGTSSLTSNSQGDIVGFAIGLLSSLSWFVLFIKPVRERVSIINTAFLSIDRPEDRPYTLLWTSTQTAANYIVEIPLAAYLMSINRMELIFIIIIINGVGDGLAEPIGVRFGKHKYKTNALFTKRKYQRSIEGSLCVFITAIVAIVVFGSSFSPVQFIAALITIPTIMTIAEAVSPHTWDNPFMFTIGEILLFLILQLII